MYSSQFDLAMMADDIASSQTLEASSPSVSTRSLSLHGFPPIFVSATHFTTEELHKAEDELTEAGASLTYDILEAKIVLTKVAKVRRIQFDLNSKGLWTEDITPSLASPLDTEPIRTPTKKRKRSPEKSSTERQTLFDDASTESETESEGGVGSPQPADPPLASTSTLLEDNDVVEVVQMTWFEQSKQAGKALATQTFLMYRGRRIDEPISERAIKSKTAEVGPALEVLATHSAEATVPHSTNDILSRAKADAPESSSTPDRFGKRTFTQYSSPSTPHTWDAGHGTPIKIKYAHLLQESTTEHDDGVSSDLPEMPEWVKAGAKYACQRATPRTSPNDPFLAQLKKIKIARLLTNDEIGVRAYSTSIASLAAYPYRVTSPREVMALPGCDAKIANLFVEWKNEGRIKAVDDLDADEDLKVLRLFYEIWGVGAKTAREFYFDRGWKDLDDIVEFGWSTLTRVQQIGVKFYDEFLDPIPRIEVEQIAKIIHQHAVKVRNEEIQSLVVGGYRRGKEACGDVDIIISHPDETQTLNLVSDIVTSLEEEDWITHTLLLSLHSTHRDQQTLPFKNANAAAGSGFDTLDKALVVWQNPAWPGRHTELIANPKAKNPNIHRRVDIIIAPWRTVGCAVVGWSGGTTFQRDLRRYVKHEKGWKFDSSGIRSRSNGEVVDVEGWMSPGQRAKSMEEAERRVFQGMGLQYREPWDRCTG